MVICTIESSYDTEDSLDLQNEDTKIVMLSLHDHIIEWNPTQPTILVQHAKIFY